MRELPKGTVTFLFTDIEGSTRLLHELGDAYVGVLAEHRRICAEGNIDRALELFREGVALLRAVGFTWAEENTLENLSELALDLGRLDEAETHARAALALSHRMDDRLSTMLSTALLARTAALRGDGARAGRLWGAVEAEERRGALGIWEHQRDEAAQAVLAVTGPEFEAARREGRLLTLAGAVAEELGEDGVVPDGRAGDAARTP